MEGENHAVQEVLKLLFKAASFRMLFRQSKTRASERKGVNEFVTNQNRDDRREYLSLRLTREIIVPVIQ